MFDVGFWELALIGIVALLVIGPERLPAFARTVGLYVGKARRMVNQVRNDIEREIRSEELRRTFEESKALREAADSLDDARKSIEASATSSLETFRSEVDPDYRPAGGHADDGPSDDGYRDPDDAQGDDEMLPSSGVDSDQDEVDARPEPASTSDAVGRGAAGDDRDLIEAFADAPADVDDYDDDELPWPDEVYDDLGEGNARSEGTAERPRANRDKSEDQSAR